MERDTISGLRWFLVSCVFYHLDRLNDFSNGNEFGLFQIFTIGNYFICPSMVRFSYSFLFLPLHREEQVVRMVKLFPFLPYSEEKGE